VLASSKYSARPECRTREGLQIGLTEGQEGSSTQFGPVYEFSRVEFCKELVERDLDRNPSTYIKYRENPDSAERCPSEA
jgi:hypothetical protein